LSTQKAGRQSGFGVGLQEEPFAPVKQVFLGRYVLFQAKAAKERLLELPKTFSSILTWRVKMGKLRRKRQIELKLE
jgi:hypothetical protein